MCTLIDKNNIELCEGVMTLVKKGKFDVATNMNLETGKLGSDCERKS